MKKLFFMALLCVTASAAFAQSGAITINNNNTICGVYVVLYAEQPAGSFSGCSLQSVQIYLPPFPNAGWARTWATYSAFTAAIGWNGTPGPSSGATYFTWNEAYFQFNCPVISIPPCANGGTYVNALWGIYGCTSPYQNNIGSAGTCMTSIDWLPDPNGPMDDVYLNFN